MKDTTTTQRIKRYNELTELAVRILSKNFTHAYKETEIQQTVQNLLIMELIEAVHGKYVSSDAIGGMMGEFYR